MDSAIASGLLIGNRILMSFVPLLSILISPDLGSPPKLPAFFAAVAVWAIPDLVVVTKSLRTKGRTPLVLRAVSSAQKAGYSALIVVLLVGFGLRASGVDMAWWPIAFGAFFLGTLFEETHLRRNLRRLAVYDR